MLAGVGLAPEHLQQAFAELLLRPDEAEQGWIAGEDGFEPWLGPIRRVA